MAPSGIFERAYDIVGIWERLSSQEVVDAVKSLLSSQRTLDEISEAVCHLARKWVTTHEYGLDDMTVILVPILLNGETERQWRKRCRKCPSISRHVARARDALSSLVRKLLAPGRPRIIPRLDELPHLRLYVGKEFLDMMRERNQYAAAPEDAETYRRTLEFVKFTEEELIQCDR